MGSDNFSRVPTTRPSDASDSERRPAARSEQSRDRERTTLHTRPRGCSRAEPTPPKRWASAAQTFGGLRRSPFGYPYAHSTRTKELLPPAPVQMVHGFSSVPQR